MTHAFVLLCLIQVLQLSVSFNPSKPWWWFGFNPLSIIRRYVILIWFVRPGMRVGTDWREREENRLSLHTPESKGYSRRKCTLSCTCFYWWQLQLRNSAVSSHYSLISDISRLSVGALKYRLNQVEDLLGVYIRLTAIQSQKLHLVLRSHALFLKYS